MNNKLHVHPGYSVSSRQPEGEGVLRMLLLAVAVAMPLASMAYLKIQHTRLSYAMSEVRAEIKKQEELQRNLLLERSHYQKDEEIQVFAEKVGMMPRKQSYLIHRGFTPKDQKLAKLRPVFSDE
ncbi:hypothetical protein [Holophaga foetida]|uniref:hypothetical protein n=1 Tax=Holophaga foetida TaxID=35839 RepID=UPI0002471C59|nr:hypothetical protein [Holophaga foetida]